MISIKSPFIVLFLLLFFINADAQVPVLQNDFENVNAKMSVTGIAGKALNYGPTAIERFPLVSNNPLSTATKGFTVMLWVNTDVNSREQYDIISSLKQNGNMYNGWKLIVTPSGSWEFRAVKDSQSYTYAPTSARQTIRDGDWHLLAVTFMEDENSLRFYYDGRLKAIYNTERISGFYRTDTLVVGAAMDSEHYTGKGRWQNFWDTYNGMIDELSLFDVAVEDSKIDSIYRKLKNITNRQSVAAGGDTFKVSSFNIFHGGHEYGKEVGKKRLIDMLKDEKADAYLLIETYGSGAEIADALDGYLYLISSNLSIISRHPFTKTFRHKESFKSGGAQVSLGDGRVVNLFCVWLDWLPVFSSRDFTSGRTMEQYLNEENARRGKDINAILDQIKPQLQTSAAVPLILGGDFNSGSHLDHTEATRAMHNGYMIPWPVSISMKQAGFIDSYRYCHPDPLLQPGITFSPLYQLWLKERIDFIYYKGNIKAKASKVIDSHPVWFPSDHAMVSSVFSLKNE